MLVRYRSLLFIICLLMVAGPLAAPVAGRQDVSERDSWPTAYWQTATPAEVGMDAALLEQADARYRAEWPLLSAVVVVREGKLVYEGSYNGFYPSRSVDIWSATKSVTSALVGIAIEEGLLTIDQTLGELIPERIPANADPQTQNITVRHLLTMTSGWAWDGTVDYANLETAEDWAGRTLSLPVVSTPGTAYTYNSGNTMVLSVIIQAVSGQTLLEYAQPRLFDPIGMIPGGWTSSPQGETAGAHGLFLRPRDMARFGYLYLNEGRWDDQQVVPAEWVRESTTFQSQPIPEHDFGRGTGYGYQWWLIELYGYDAYFALGYGEQIIMVIPDLDLVIVAAVADAPTVDLLQRPRPIMFDVIIPAAL